ncbi:HNH endonuclease signature motif containing protein [Streptomyces sp. NPDC054838]
MPQTQPLERIFRMVTESGGCWVWNGGFSNGYPNVKIDGRAVGVHRFLFEYTKGRLRRGVRIKATCGAAGCVRHWTIAGAPADPFAGASQPAGVAEVFEALRKYAGRGREPLYASVSKKLKANSESAPNGCIHWTGSTARGYGQIWANGKMRKAHVVAYEDQVGPVPGGMQLDHRCHNQDPDCDLGEDCPHRRCINTDHLEPATSSENTLRGKTLAAHNAAKTHLGEHLPAQGRRQALPDLPRRAQP